MAEDEARMPYGAAAVVGGIPIYAKPELPPGNVEFRDRYGLLIGTLRGVASISMTGDKKE